MDQIGQFLTQFATKEVFTVLAALVTAWIGYKTACKTGGLIKKFATGASWGGLTAAGLLFAGFAGVGLGLGESFTRTGDSDSAPAIQGISDGKLENLLAKASSYDNEGKKITAILEYAKERDDKNRRMQLAWKLQTLPEEEWGEALAEYSTVPIKLDNHFESIPLIPFPDAVEIRPAPEAINDESIMSVPVATLSIFVGIASIIVSCYVFANRNKNRRFGPV